MTLWWFDQLSDVTANHFVSVEVPETVKGRSMITERLQMMPIECVVRGYIAGSGLAEYRETGSICGVELPEGLEECDELPEPIFTPAAKAQVGSTTRTSPSKRSRIGSAPEHALQLREKSIALYTRAREIAKEKGVILADTKFEFGYRLQPGEKEPSLRMDFSHPGLVALLDASIYEPGKPQPSLDKQFIRDWLTSEESDWD